MTQPDSEPRPQFAGSAVHVLDDKSRCTIPARWRSSGMSELYMVASDSRRTLLLLPFSELEKMSDEVARAEDWSPEDKAAFERQLFAKAMPSPLDKSGRVVLPDDQCQRLGLTGEVMLIGARTRIEIWNKEDWDVLRQSEEDVFKRGTKRFGF